MARKYKCKHCQEFKEESIRLPVGRFCCYEHATRWAQEKAEREFMRKLNKETKEKEKAARAKHRERKEALRPRAWYLKEAQKWFNKFIRLRDGSDDCISCGREYVTGNGGKFSMFDAGHYRSVGANPELRFEESNCNSQCVRCNRELSGNVANYRINLLKKIGSEKLEWLEGPHEPKKYTIDDLKEIIQEYKAKCKQFD